MRILAFESMRQVDTAVAFGQVLFVNQLDVAQVFLQKGDQAVRQRRSDHVALYGQVG